MLYAVAVAVAGAAASVAGMVVTFKGPWDADLFSVGSWRAWLAIITVVSLLAAVVLRALEPARARRRRRPRLTAAQDFRPTGIS